MKLVKTENRKTNKQTNKAECYPVNEAKKTKQTDKNGEKLEKQS